MLTIICWIQLAIAAHVGNAKRLADVGSGGGLPGIPLAIARPDLQVTLVDASQKKCGLHAAGEAIELGSPTCHRVHASGSRISARTAFPRW
jgi:16S rRNA (guanine527-N7)-methyltransferase